MCQRFAKKIKILGVKNTSFYKISWDNLITSYTTILLSSFYFHISLSTLFIYDINSLSTCIIS